MFHADSCKRIADILIILLVLLATGCIAGCASQPQTLAINVSDAFTGGPLSGAVVTQRYPNRRLHSLLGVKPIKDVVAVTDSYGQVHLANVLKGHYFAIRKRGYLPTFVYGSFEPLGNYTWSSGVDLFEEKTKGVVENGLIEVLVWPDNEAD